ncbi:unnamed protein product [Spirodela intermedia]|uniref:Tektin n=1 Tax=Spirodela intermedia TaxID=51605 RepID=A0ABN7EDM3_SPIIN|nr:unnamed protein product [Spirodela intermedia]
MEAREKPQMNAPPSTPQRRWPHGEEEAATDAAAGEGGQLQVYGGDHIAMRRDVFFFLFFVFLRCCCTNFAPAFPPHPHRGSHSRNRNTITRCSPLPRRTGRWLELDDRRLRRCGRRQDPIEVIPTPEGSCYADENRFEPAQGHRISETPCPSGIQRGKAAVSQSRREAQRWYSDGSSTERNAAITVTPRPTPDDQNQARSLGGRTGSRRSSTQVNRSLQETLKGAGQRWPGTPSSEYEANYSRSGNTSPENSTTTEFSETKICSISSPGGMGICDSPPIHGQSSRSRLSSESLRSSHARSGFAPDDGYEGFHRREVFHADSSSYRGISSSLCHRSLNSALSSCHPDKYIQPPASVNWPLRPRTIQASDEAETAIRKMGLDSRKEEDVESPRRRSTLRLLENCYLQWRFVNVKAQAAMEAREIVAERSLHALSTNLLELRDSVTKKHIELNEQRRMSNVSTIVQHKMGSLEDEYSSSLSGAAKSLQDASLRLPVSGNVKDWCDLHSATDVLESLASGVKCFLPKNNQQIICLQADGMQNVASDLAKVVCEERALIEECGDLLAGVKECSLRAHLIQLRRTK